MKRILLLTALGLSLTLPACVSSSERFHREEAYTRCYTAPHEQKEQCIAAHIAAMEAEERSSNSEKEADQ